MRFVVALITIGCVSLALPCVAVQTAPFVWVDQKVFVKYTSEQKLEYIKSMQGELIRQATALSELNRDSFEKLMTEATWYRKAANVLDGFWYGGNAAIAFVLAAKTTAVALGAATAFPVVALLILSTSNIGIGLVGKGADYFREKAGECLKQAGAVADRLASDIQQAEQIREHAIAMEQLITDVIAELTRNDFQPGQPDDVITESVPLMRPQDNGNAIMEPILEPHLGIDEFYGDLDADQQQAYLDRLYTMFNEFRRQIDEFTRTRFDTLVQEVKTDRNAAFGLNLAWMITHGAETIFFTVMYALMAQAVIGPQQWVEPVGLALTAIGTGLGAWADRYTRSAIASLTTAIQSARDFAKELHERVAIYRAEIGPALHQQRVAARVRGVTGRPPPPNRPPSQPDIIIPTHNDARLRALGTVADDKGKDEKRDETLVEAATVARATVTHTVAIPSAAPPPLTPPKAHKPKKKGRRVLKPKAATANPVGAPASRNENDTQTNAGEIQSVLPAAFLGATPVTKL